MKKVFIRFPTTGKIQVFSLAKSSFGPNQEVLVEIEGMVERATVVPKPDSTITSEEGTGKILRATTPEDHEHLCLLKSLAREYIEEASRKVNRHGLGMQILDAELSFDEKKLTFYFSAKGRIDFRSLVTDMVKSFDKVIRLQQVGARDEAKYFAGFGKCGRELCCAKFLNNLESITLEMAQVQELATAGSAKLSGCCGKLMCCLSFEAENYKELKKKI